MLSDLKKLCKGMVLVHRPTGSAVTLDRRKADDTGWWNADGSGLSDRVFADNDWLRLDDVLDRLDTAEAGCQARRVATGEGTETGQLALIPAQLRQIAALLDAGGARPDSAEILTAVLESLSPGHREAPGLIRAIAVFRFEDDMEKEMGCQAEPGHAPGHAKNRRPHRPTCRRRSQ